MLNFLCNNNDKKKKKKKHKKIKKKIIKKELRDYRDSNLGYMGSESTKVSATLWRSMHFPDKNDQ